MRNPQDMNLIKDLMTILCCAVSHAPQDLSHYVFFLHLIMFFSYFAKLQAFQKLIRMQ